MYTIQMSLFPWTGIQIVSCDPCAMLGTLMLGMKSSGYHNVILSCLLSHMYCIVCTITVLINVETVLVKFAFLIKKTNPCNLYNILGWTPFHELNAV